MMFKKISKIIITGCVVGLLSVFVYACSEQTDSKTESKEIDTKKDFIIGLIPEQDLFSQKKRYEPLAAYLSKKLDLAIELKILSRYGNIITNFVANDLDAAFFGSFTGALAVSKLGVQPIARPEYFDGTSTYYGMVFVRKDSLIKNASDLKGKTFAFVDKATTAGWLLPLYYFKQLGIDDYRTVLGETYFTGTHEDAIYDVLDGKADIGAAKNTVFERLSSEDSRLREELLIIHTSPKVPSNSLAVSKDIGDPLKTKLQEVLLGMENDIEGQKVLKDFGAARFITTSKEDYKPVFKFAESIGLDLKTYDYIND